jgi:hypothetical protein
MPSEIKSKYSISKLRGLVKPYITDEIFQEHKNRHNNVKTNLYFNNIKESFSGDYNLQPDETKKK